MNTDSNETKLINLEAVRNLLSKARERQDAASVEGLTASIDQLQKKVDDTNAKIRSANFQIEQIQKSQTEANVLVNELVSLRQHVNDGEYKASLACLNDQLRKLEIDFVKTTELITTLKNEAIRSCDELAKLRDQRNCLKDPNYKPKFNSSQTSEHLCQDCSPDVAEAYRRTDLLCKTSESKDCDFKKMVIALKVEAARLRLCESMLPGTERKSRTTDELLLRRAMALIAGVAKRFNLGYIDALNPNFTPPDWRRYIDATAAQAMSGFAIRTGSSDGAAAKELIREFPVAYPISAPMKAETTPPAQAPAAEEAEPEEKDDTAIMLEQLKRLNIDHRMPNIRLAIFGGILKKNVKLGQWLQETFGFSSVKWYDCDHDCEHRYQKTLIASIENKGVDVLLIFSQWVSHSAYGPVMETAKRCNIPTILTPRKAKRDLINRIVTVCTGKDVVLV